MSVYTSIEHAELEQFLSNYSLGTLLSFEGISAGIENTNYFVNTSVGEFVLTIFEALGEDELPYFLNLMAYLAENNFPSAHPQADKQGCYLQHLKRKPASLVQRLKGHTVKQPTATQCAALGKALGHMHAVGQNFPQTHDNLRGAHWWQQTAQRLSKKLSAAQSQILRDELLFQAQQPCESLPRGIIHADLFRDNALFEGEELSGIIDFYYACNDVLLYDVAITVNDWCVHEDGQLDTPRLTILLNAYQCERQFTAAEHIAWPVMLRAAALRFWLSRCLDLYFPRDGELTHTHDPDVFLTILQHRISITNTHLLPELAVDKSVDE